jgi:hypothetical protein
LTGSSPKRRNEARGARGHGGRVATVGARPWWAHGHGGRAATVGARRRRFWRLPRLHGAPRRPVGTPLCSRAPAQQMPRRPSRAPKPLPSARPPARPPTRPPAHPPAPPRPSFQSWSRERLAAEGVALFSLSAAPDGQIYRDSVLKFFRPNMPLPFHALSQVGRGRGRAVRGGRLGGRRVGTRALWLQACTRGAGEGLRPHAGAKSCAGGDRARHQSSCAPRLPRRPPANDACVAPHGTAATRARSAPTIQPPQGAHAAPATSCPPLRARPAPGPGPGFTGGHRPRQPRRPRGRLIGGRRGGLLHPVAARRAADAGAGAGGR